MHTRHEEEFVKLLSQLSAEESKQKNVSVLLVEHLAAWCGS